MAIRGAAAKEKVTNDILSKFEGAFLNGKEIRIPMYDETSGEVVQIKVTLTAAKDMVEMGSDIALPSAETVTTTQKIAPSSNENIVEPSADEINSMKNLLAKFNL